MLKFFDVYVEYENSNERYTEPSDNPYLLLKNIMKYELSDISWDSLEETNMLKFFSITSR